MRWCVVIGVAALVARVAAAATCSQAGAVPLPDDLADRQSPLTSSDEESSRSAIFKFFDIPVRECVARNCNCVCDWKLSD